jgi:hypothetical protein
MRLGDPGGTVVRLPAGIQLLPGVRLLSGIRLLLRRYFSGVDWWKRNRQRPSSSNQIELRNAEPVRP